MAAKKKTEIDEKLRDAILLSAVDWCGPGNVQDELKADGQDVRLSDIALAMDALVKAEELEKDARSNRYRRRKDKRSPFERRAYELLDEMRQREASTANVNQKLTTWLRAKGVNYIEDIINPPPPKPTRDVFYWSEKRKVDDSEKARIFDQVRLIERDIAIEQAGLDSYKDSSKGRIKALEKRASELKAEADEKFREVRIEAYKEPDWQKGIVFIRDAETDAILAKEPMKPGEQRTIEGGGAPKAKARAASKSNGAASAEVSP